MSSFHVGSKHINAILSWCDIRTTGFHYILNGTLGTTDLAAAGQMLFDENNRNLRRLYGAKGVYKAQYEWEKDTVFADVAKPEDVFLLLSCYAYQCCDRPQWSSPRNKVSRFVDAARVHVAQHLSVIEDCRTWSYGHYIDRVLKGIA